MYNSQQCLKQMPSVKLRRSRALLKWPHARIVLDIARDFRDRHLGKLAFERVLRFVEYSVKDRLDTATHRAFGARLGAVQGEQLFAFDGAINLEQRNRFGWAGE